MCLQHLSRTRQSKYGTDVRWNYPTIAVENPIAYMYKTLSSSQTCCSHNKEEQHSAYIGLNDLGTKTINFLIINEKGIGNNE